MSAEKFVLVASVVVAATTLVLAHPTHPHIRSVDLSEAINRTVCPIRVEIDENPDRVPRRIKMMKCSQEPNHWCSQHHIPRAECCQHKHANHVMECVEMYDTVLVYYQSTAKTDKYEVSVGCTCMIEQSTNAPALPDHNR